MSASAYHFLKNIPLFANLPAQELVELCEGVEELHLSAGSVLFTEGSLGRHAYIIQDGKLEVYKMSGGRQVRMDIRQEGDVIGEIALLESTTRTASVRALTDATLFAISDQQLDRMMSANPAVSRILLHTVASRLRASELLLRQSEKMAQLGTLAAGIAHELNNPAAAAQRGSEQMQTAFGQYQQAQIELSRLSLQPEQWERLSSLEDRIRQAASRPDELDSLQRSDHESEIEDWLDDRSIENGWEVAPLLVSVGLDTDQLDELAATFRENSERRQVLPAVLTWVGSSYTVYALLEEIGQGTTRIAEIVKALKSYVYLDQAPVQEVSVQEGLDNTLVMLRNKLKQGVDVYRNYDPQTPRIQAYGSELNQVWTNLIDNAVDALEGKGHITIQTEYQDPWVVVSIEDNGPGIPEEVQAKLFSPFFTTKPVGKGTGLGLNISYNIIRKHHGEIKVTSQPGKTCFEVRLPVDFRSLEGS
jgi:signal transduction histidine kinase